MSAKPSDEEPSEGSEFFYMQDGKKADAALHEGGQEASSKALAKRKAKERGLSEDLAERYYGDQKGALG